MLRYRALLIDTERSYERPVQAHFTTLSLAEDWAVKTLRGASEKASVVVYRVTEVELATITLGAKGDPIPVQDIQPAAKAPSKP